MKTKRLRPQQRLLDGESAVEGDRISPLKGNGQALEQKHCLLGVLSDKCDPLANFLNQLNSHLVPCPSSFNGKWEDEVSAGKITILGGLVGSCLVCGTVGTYYSGVESKDS